MVWTAYFVSSIRRPIKPRGTNWYFGIDSLSFKDYWEQIHSINPDINRGEYDKSRKGS